MIYCIGNSHIRVFRGQEGFTTYHLGPTIAYNFYEHHLPKVLGYLTSIHTDPGDKIALIVGEVDCRLHLPRQADIQKRSDEDMTRECVTRLMRCYDVILQRGYEMIAFSTHPTTTEGHDMSQPDRPIYGPCYRRNNICLLWNKYVKAECDQRAVPFISFYDELVDEHNVTRMEYFTDYCHLDPVKLQPIIREKLNEIHST